MEMAPSASELTKIASNLLIGVKELCDWGIDEGHIDPDQMKLTVTGLRLAGSKLIEGGSSKRGAAKLLGVPESTLRDALDPDSAKKKSVRAKRAKDARKARDIKDIPSEEEAEKSYQDTIFEQACLLLSEMADETRQRFFAKLREEYPYAS